MKRTLWLSLTALALVGAAGAQDLVIDRRPPKDEVAILQAYMYKHGPNKLMEAYAEAYTFEQRSLKGKKLWSLDVGSGLMITQWVLTSGEGKSLKVIKDFGCIVSTKRGYPALYVEKRGLIIKVPSSTADGKSKLLVLGKIPQ